MRLPTLVLAALLLCGACGNGEGTKQSTRPYVVTAIDYHFHDAHPSLPIELQRPVQFSNQGSNPHNVTIEGTPYDRMVPPGRRITIDPIGSLLSSPGRYPFYCKLHRDRGMAGVLVVVSG